MDRSVVSRIRVKVLETELPPLPHQEGSNG
jgi:hypothetical protein